MESSSGNSENGPRRRRSAASKSFDGISDMARSLASPHRGGRKPIKRNSSETLAKMGFDSNAGISSPTGREKLKSLKGLQKVSSKGSYGPLGMYGGSNHSSESGATPVGEEPQSPFMKAIRRGSMSKEESQRNLHAKLSMVQDYQDYDESESGTSVQELKEKLRPNMKSLKNKRRGVARRSSISSISSYTSNSSAIDASTGHVSSAYSMEMSELLGGASTSSSLPIGVSFDASAKTLPMQNNNVPNDVGPDPPRRNGKKDTKVDQIVESLVWFSFHTPRAVLEDLITHEIGLYKNQLLANSSHHANSKKKQKFRMTSKGMTAAADDDDNSGSVSSLSEDGATAENFDNHFTESMMRAQGRDNKKFTFDMPKAIHRECALLFVDMSGFTKLSTMLDVESLSKVINSYFDMIVSEVILHGGDIMKFAGDAFFAEWKVNDSTQDDEGKGNKKALSDLNNSLVSINDWDDIDEDLPKLSKCVLAAAKCAVSIVEKFSDYKVTSASGSSSDAMLNVHCGLGVGDIVGLHVGDYKEDQEEEGVELRREFLILGDAIDQVSKAADLATDGQVMASPEAMKSLSFCCDMMYSAKSNKSVCIASRKSNFLDLEPFTPGGGDAAMRAALQPYESLRMHCKSLNNAALKRLHLQMALYVHPVIRGDELALSAAIQAGSIMQPTETVESRHRAEAELRSVFTIFIKAVMSPKVTGVAEVDQDLYQRLGDIMHVTSRELDRYSGHLRQFIVDDKGVVLIATFGLRGSTFPNMVSNNGLPAVFAIHRALKAEVNIESRIGATFGKVYCGVVGGVRRHEFAVMGAPVNLAARLMSSKVNNGILVDEAVRAQTDGRFEFKSLPPVKAKGYDKPVPILEPINKSTTAKKKKSSFPFTGRKEEKKAIVSAATEALDDPTKPGSMIFLMGESGMGKTALALSAMDDVKKCPSGRLKSIVTARSTSTEMEQRIPLSSYRKIFMSIVRDLCDHEGALEDSFSSSHSKDSTAVPSPMRRRRVSLNLDEAVEQKSPRRPMLRRAPSQEWDILEDVKEQAVMNTLSQSLRDISADLADTNAQEGRGSTRNLSASGLNSSVHKDLSMQAKRRGKSELGTSLHRLTAGPSTSSPRKMSMPIKAHSNSLRASRASISKTATIRDDSSMHSSDAGSLHRGGSVPYFEKLLLVCDELDYSYAYADIVGSQFLGLEKAAPVTHVDGHVPTMDELVEFLALAFICLADFADLAVLFVDDFQWVDSFSWKIFRVLCKRGKKLLLLCAMRSHDKQALRRLSTAATREVELQNQMIEISLAPLDFSNIRSLMAVVLGHEKKAIPEALCGDIYQRTGGLPVYVVQMLENVKRKSTLELNGDGVLQWTAAGLKENKRATGNNQAGAVMEETFLSRFDSLDVRVRKVLQTCAVLGLTFALSDVLQVHPEMEENDIENAIDAAVDEMVLVEQVEDNEDDDDETLSLKSASTRTDSLSFDKSRTFHSDGSRNALQDRFFQFSHAMWRKNVLTTMLKERKLELHRLIAESMEKSQMLISEESDITRLLTLFDHWKSCGDFCKSAPLALTVGARLEEWDLSAQSLELYEDSLEMSFDSVRVTQEGRSDWIHVAAKPAVLDLILRLHVRIGLCHQRLGDENESIATFEDAFKTIKTASKVPGSSRSLMMPIISSLCVLKTAQEERDPKELKKQEKLLGVFTDEAIKHKSPVHIGRSLAMQATFQAKGGDLERAVEIVDDLRKKYKVENNSNDMVAEYGRDFVIECLAECVQWLYLLEEHERAEKEADSLIEHYLPLVDPMDTDACVHVVLPVVQVLRLVGRASDADWLVKRYIINPAHDNAVNAEFWMPFFNPLAYVIEIMMMEESEKYNPKVLEEMEAWVLDAANSEFNFDLERKCHAFMGEICWRLANFRDDDDPIRQNLVRKAKSLLMPVARYPHNEIFLKHTAEALMEAF